MSEPHIDVAALDRVGILPRLIRRQAAEIGDKPFAVMVNGPSMTYAQTHHESMRWASALQHLGVDAEQTVATMLPIGLTSITAWIGISWLRAWEVPLNTDYRGRMLTHALEAAAVGTIIIDRCFLDRLQEVASQLPLLRRVIVTGTDDGAMPEVGPGLEVVCAEAVLAQGPRVESFDGPEPWDISAIIYTSGTTGPSKGVLVPWAQMLAILRNPLFEGFGPEDHRYSPFPMYHISGKASCYGAALNGAQVVLKERWSVSEFWPDIEKYRCTFTWLVGAMPTLLFAQPESSGDARTPLRYALMAPVHPEYREFERRFDLKLCTVYNMSEMSMPVISDWDLANHRTCGRPRPGYEVRLVDEYDLPVGVGEFGEFVVRSHTPWTMNLGYLGMPDMTARAWRHGWFHTGDGGTCDADGNLYYVDRIKYAIRRRGENISSIEVEAEVLAHPAICECAAIGVPSPLGEEDVFVFVVAAGGEPLDPAGLLEFLEPRMPKFMLPRYVQVVHDMPKTPTQRVRKAELRELVDIGGTAWDRETGAGG